MTRFRLRVVALVGTLLVGCHKTEVRSDQEAVAFRHPTPKELPVEAKR